MFLADGSRPYSKFILRQGWQMSSSTLWSVWGLATLLILFNIQYLTARESIAGPTMRASEVLPSVGKFIK